MTATASHTSRAGRPRTSTLDRPTLMRLAAEEYVVFGELLATIPDASATSPTNCRGWDIRAMASHVLGMAEMAASMREGRRQQKAAGRRGGVFIHALTALQVEEHAALSLGEVARRLRVVAPKAARSRRRVPGLVRGRRMPISQPVGGHDEDWTIGFLVDTILTRDVWMHRMDLCLALDRTPLLTPEHDGVLVADVVQEWALRHGQPCQVRLSGPAGGTWAFGSGGPAVELDAVEFCRTVSRRAVGVGLLDVEVPF
jgi:uncharacterized protein (TIGR03083 family)